MDACYQCQYVNSEWITWLESPESQGCDDVESKELPFWLTC